VNFVEKKLLYLFNVPFVMGISVLNIDFPKTIHALKYLGELHLDFGKQKSAKSNPRNYHHFREGHGQKRLQIVQNVHQNELRL